MDRTTLDDISTSTQVCFLQGKIKELREENAALKSRIEQLTTCPTCKTTHYACDCQIALVQKQKARIEELEKLLRQNEKGDD